MIVELNISEACSAYSVNAAKLQRMYLQDP